MMVAKVVEKYGRLIIYVKAYITNAHLLVHFINVNTDTMQHHMVLHPRCAW